MNIKIYPRICPTFKPGMRENKTHFALVLIDDAIDAQKKSTVDLSLT